MIQSEPNSSDNRKTLFVISKDPENTESNGFNCSSQKDEESIDSNQIGRWTLKEHERFIIGILQYGNEWKKVEEVVKTRSSTQARSHAQKFFIKLKNTHLHVIGSFPTIKKFCEQVKALDTNKRKLLHMELKRIPFDSEDRPLRHIKRKLKHPKHSKMKQMKKMRTKSTQINQSESLFSTKEDKINPFPPVKFDNITVNKSHEQANTMNSHSLKASNDQSIVYNHNINNVSINLHSNCTRACQSEIVNDPQTSGLNCSSEGINYPILAYMENMNTFPYSNYSSNPLYSNYIQSQAYTAWEHMFNQPVNYSSNDLSTYLLMHYLNRNSL